MMRTTASQSSNPYGTALDSSASTMASAAPAPRQPRSSARRLAVRAGSGA